MKALKQILVYLIWTITALLLGIGYMRIVLGPNKASTEGLWYLLHIFFDLGLFYVGLVIGVVIAFLFILLDVFYLKKKLKNSIKSNVIRFGFLLVITVFVAVIHYVLEKVVDII
ncbi:hypothetical protein [Aquimarina sp. 2201CG14-23]|uniref:hypothetical protein n=1 Tax=Aquimarina mycalae TaxID=3040073 RepID=UPI0024780E1C|nr:hypothetical protein [Aquimarina sp. 2201CG14-23]MDH7447575.1 hypothetical protein [Aquimarina sp. 2201CG14-23]